MNLAALKTELIARGAENDSTRLEAWINLAYREIWNMYEWPFTEAQVTGTAGAGVLTVPTDFRRAIVVGDASSGTTPGTPLAQITVAELSEDYGVDNLSTTGTPQFWYYDAIAGQIKTYPLGGTVYLRYYKRVAVLTGTNTPAFSDEYHNLIVDRAMVEVYKNNDELTNASNAMAAYSNQLRLMAEDYQVISRAVSYIQVGTPYDG